MSLLNQDNPCRFGDLQEFPWPQDRPLIPAEEVLPAGTRLFSSDSHILEPEDWTEYMPSKLRDRAPREWVDERGHVHQIFNGTEVTVGLHPCVGEGRPGIRDVAQRMRDLDAEGVEAEMLYPQRSFALITGIKASHRDVVLQDEEYVGGFLDAYNLWLSRVCAASNGRLHGAALVRFWDPQGVAENLVQIKELGFHNIVLPNAPPGVQYNRPEMDPLWTAIEESGLPVSFHVGERFETEGPGAFGSSMMMQFHPYRRLWSLLAFSGILERHPGLRVIFTEGQLHWIPGALQDADIFHKSFRSILEPRLARPPSEYWHRNCYATFQEDAVGLSMIDRIGADRILWASDYPHPESVVGRCAQSAQAVIDAVGPARAKAILNDNARQVWALT
jgi:predicted TIM-barrel fold metal-dependent hydrolase